jgi:hypothetical protein
MVPESNQGGQADCEPRGHRAAIHSRHFRLRCKIDHHLDCRFSPKIGSASDQAMIVEEELQRQNKQLELLLNLTTRITSSLDLREVLRSIAANIREVIHADAVVVSLPDVASGKFRAFAVDFPHGK